MQLKLRIALLLTFSLSTSYAVRPEDLHYVQGCTILSYAGKELKNFPGTMCLFFDDGSVISGAQYGLKFYDRMNSIKWEMQGNFHHQLALSTDRKRILALSSSVVDDRGEKRRIDKFMVIDLTGKVLHETDARKLLEFAGLKGLDWKILPWNIPEEKVEKELSHFNSFYEIPPQTNPSKTPGLQEGNFVVNGYRHGIFFLSSDLKKIHHYVSLETSKNNLVHDVQVTPSGRLLYFNNVASASTETTMYSTVEEYDLNLKKLHFQFSTTPKMMFFSRYCGSVQDLDRDFLLFTDKYNGTYIYSRKEQTVVTALRATHFRNDALVANQYTKAYDLSKFMKSRQE